MESFLELQEPDVARPAKRARLDAPLGITEDVQEEIIDDGDWDDVYGPAATPTREASPDGGVPVIPEPITAEEDEKGGEEKEDGLPAEAIDDGDELVVEGLHTASTDGPAARMLEETAQVEGGAVHKDEDVEDAIDDEEGEQHIHGNQDAQDDGQQSEDAKLTANNDNGPPVGESTNGDTAQAESQAVQDSEVPTVAPAQTDDQEAEWQFESSDAQSSSDSDSESGSEDSSDDPESGSEGGYEMLDPETAAKILMSGDGDDDDGEKAKNKTGDHQPRTANEIKEVVVPKPDVIVTEDMKTTFLGNVDRTVDNMLLIKAVTPGEFQVLESGSVLCNEKREVIGAVAETLGRVQEPMYSVAFTNAKEIEGLGLEYGAKVFYVDNHSTFVFTQPLKSMRGTDASNIHDEEVGEDELEFSDDEAEAEYKRQKKLAKRGGRGGLSRGAFNEERAARSFGAPGHDSGQTFINGSDAPQQNYGGGMSYDDGDVQEEFYVPLKRPDNLSQLMASGGPPLRRQQGSFDRGRGRGRGDRGRGRGDRGRGRGGFDHRNQRGGRGGFGQRETSRGAYGQQDGHRGNAHSFPDRHNSDRPNGHSHARRSHQNSPPAQPPSHQQSHQQYQQYQPQTSNQQNYQFNGYTFQYGTSPLPQPPTAQAGGYHNPQQTAQSPTGTGAFPAGAYVNPAFFQNQQQQQQWVQPASGWQGQQQAQSYQHAQPCPVQLDLQQQNNLADILRQFGGQQQR